MDISSKIEAILFWKGEPITIKKIASILSLKTEEVELGLKKLDEDLSRRGIILQRKSIQNNSSDNDEVTLGTNPLISELIEKLTKEELIRDLGKAGLETLSIILYRGPVKRSDVDYIRGVNSSFILRNLLVRGLVERTEKNISSISGQSGRGYLYSPTFKLLSHLGLSNLHDLPEYDKVREEMKVFEESQKESASEELPV